MKKHFFIFLFSPLWLFSQELNFSTESSKNNLLVGEPTVIKATINIPASKVIDSISFRLPRFNDSLGNNWELWNISDLKNTSFQTPNNDYFIKYQQEFTVANFDTGKFEFPPAIAFINGEEYYSNPLLFNIQLQEIDPNASIKNLKPIKEISVSWWEYVLYFFKNYGIFIIIGLLFVGLIYFLLKKLKKTTKNEDLLPSVPIEILLLEQLEEIEQKKLWQNGYFKKHYSQISEILWKFLEHRYQIKTFEKTSQEILKSLKWTTIPEKFLIEISRFFELSDGVKFAKLKPIERDNLNAISITRSLIEEERIDIEKLNSNQIDE